MCHLFLSLTLSDAVSILNTDNRAIWSSSDQFFGLPIGCAGDDSLILASGHDSLIFAKVSSYCFHSLQVVFGFFGVAEIKINKSNSIMLIFYTCMVLFTGGKRCAVHPVADTDG